jgi:hypothetical protein
MIGKCTECMCVRARARENDACMYVSVRVCVYVHCPHLHHTSMLTTGNDKTPRHTHTQQRSLHMDVTCVSVSCDACSIRAPIGP